MALIRQETVVSAMGTLWTSASKPRAIEHHATRKPIRDKCTEPVVLQCNKIFLYVKYKMNSDKLISQNLYLVGMYFYVLAIKYNLLMRNNRGANNFKWGFTRASARPIWLQSLNDKKKNL